MTLVDLSEEMLAVSRELNPECEHLQGDMRTVRLGRTFDAVFVHDAIEYMTTEADLRQAIATAYVHCRPGGVAVLVPDDIAENFEPATDHGGQRRRRRPRRPLSVLVDRSRPDRHHDPDRVRVPASSADGTVQVAHDTHVLGLFPRELWLRVLTDAGFAARIGRRGDRRRPAAARVLCRKPSSGRRIMTTRAAAETAHLSEEDPTP